MGLTAKQWTLSGLAVELRMDRRALGKRLTGVAAAGTFRKSPTYLMADVVAVVFGPGGDDGDGKLDLNAESARLKKAQADKTELEVLVLQGDLLPGHVVAETWTDFVTAARAKFVTLPSTAAPRVVGMTVREAEAELRQLVNQGLGELKDYDPNQYSTGGPAFDVGGSQDDGAAPGADGQRMGRRKQGTKPRIKCGTGTVDD
jgi:hypothetical protein